VSELRTVPLAASPPGTDEAKAMRMLEKAEHVCLITNSLTGTAHLNATVRVAD